MPLEGFALLHQIEAKQRLKWNEKWKLRTTCDYIVRFTYVRIKEVRTIFILPDSEDLFLKIYEILMDGINMQQQDYNVCRMTIQNILQTHDLSQPMQGM